MILAGIDYSMSSPAIVVYDNTKPFAFENFLIFNCNERKKVQGVYGNIRIDSLPPKGIPNEDRFKRLATWATKILKEHKVEHVQLEGYAMGASAGMVFNIAENTSVLKQMMFDAGITFDTPSPTATKKHFHGKGNAKKDEMCHAFATRFNVNLPAILGTEADKDPYKSPVNDIVDAVANLSTHPSIAM